MMGKKKFKKKEENVYEMKTEIVDRTITLLIAAGAAMAANCEPCLNKIVPDLIEAGFDCLNPVQTNCMNMEPRRLKREFGSEVVFWGGGCDGRNILNIGTAQDVRRDVHKRIEILSPGGGLVFCPIHNILPDVPPENIVAMFKAVNEFNPQR